MKNNISKLIITFISVFVFTTQSIACTAITLIDKNKNVIAGRTMEWGLDWDWKLVYMPKNTPHTLTAPTDMKLPEHKYSSKYSILGTALVAENKTMFTDGQNDQGLSLSGNYLPGFTKYQTVNSSDTNYVSIIDLPTYILSEFNTVEQVKNALMKLKVWSDASTSLKGVSPEMHFLITDKHGHGLVVEYVDGKLKTYALNSNVQVMTNAPTYDWHLTNLRNYLNLTNQTRSSIKINDLETNSKNSVQDISGLGVGNGFLGLPGDYSPPSRFVKIAAIGYYSNNYGSPDESTISKVTHILHNVDIPKGTVYEKLAGQNVYDHTSYVVIKDLNNNKLYLTTYDHPANSVMIDINKLDNSHTKVFAKSIKKLTIPNNDITSTLI